MKTLARLRVPDLACTHLALQHDQRGHCRRRPDGAAGCGVGLREQLSTCLCKRD